MSERTIRQIWSELKPLPLVERLKANYPAGRWSISGYRISGCCPYHSETTPSFHVYVDRGYAKCFGCEKYVWNPIELWSKLTGMGLTEALLDLKAQFGLKSITATSGQGLRAWERNQAVKKKLMEICHRELLQCIAAPENPEYAYARPAAEWLLKNRQIPLDALPALTMVGVMPPIVKVLNILSDDADAENKRRKEEAELTGKRFERFVSMVDEAKEYLKEASGHLGSVVFRMDLAPDVIGRLKLRRPSAGDKMIVFLADAFEEDLGYFGLGWSLYKSLIGAQQKYVPGIYVVEGEFDALTTMARQVQQGGPTFVVVSAGGNSGGYKIDDLRSFGFSEVYLVADAPDNKGDELVKSWLLSVKQLRARIFIGYNNFPGAEDPDKAVLLHGLDKYQRVLLDVENKENFQLPPEWIFEKAFNEINETDEDDVRHRIEQASLWGRYLKNGLECDQYVALCEKRFGLPAASLKREIIAKEEDEPAFIYRLVDVLGGVFHMIGQEASESDRRLYLWHKEKRRAIQVKLADDSAIERELGSVLGPAYQFFSEKVGVPPFLEPPDVKKTSGQYLQEMDKHCRWYYRQALTILTNNTPDYDTATHKGQGIHVIPNSAGGPPTIYIVNGRDVYLGKYNDVNKCEWKRLDGPSHENFVFEVGIPTPIPPWMQSVRDVEDLTRHVDLTTLTGRLRAMIDVGWKLKNHEVSARFLTAHLLATTINNAFARKTVLGFHAETSAGKSKMLMGLIAGKDYPSIRVLESTVGMQNFTVAGVRQTMRNKSMSLCLDEFENEGGHGKKERVVTETLELIRNLTGQDNSANMGSRSGAPVAYSINFFVFLAAIHKAKKVQDANRIVTIEMDKIPGWDADPVTVLLKEFGKEYITALRNDLTVAFLPHIAEIQELYAKTQSEFHRAPFAMDSRYFEALLPAITMVRFLGEDYKKFIADFSETQRETISTTAHHTDSTQLFDWLVHSPRIRRDNGVNSSVMQLLALPETRGEINISSCGVYYDAELKLLVVNWLQALQSLLSGYKYDNTTNILNLRDLGNRHPWAMRPEEVKTSGVLARLKRYSLGLDPSNLTVFRIRHIIDEADNTTKPLTATPTKPEVVREEKIIDDGDFVA